MSDRNKWIRVHHQVYTEEWRAKLYEFLTAPGWETGWKSNSKQDGYSFLHKHFAGRRKGSDASYSCEDELKAKFPLIYDAWNIVKMRWYFSNCELARCYANGMAYGMDGSVHTDAKAPGSFTFVYYPHELWSPNWGGETLFYNTEETAVVGCTYPTPNSAVIFDGRVPHRANGVTRIFTGLRITLMFKIEDIRGGQATGVPL